LIIPHTWLSLYPAVFPRSFASSFSVAPKKKPLRISLSEPICLTQVIVSALSQEAYDAGSEPSGFDSWFSDEKLVIRQGVTYPIPIRKPTMNGILPHDIPHEQEFHRYMVQMTEPALQGCVERGTTQILLLLSSEPPSEVNGLVSHENSHVGDPLEEELEIDETFLANSVLTPSVVEAQGSSSTELPDGNGISNGGSLSIEPLEGVIDVTEDDWTTYIRTADLSRVGLLDGDWVHILLTCIIQVDLIISCSGRNSIRGFLAQEVCQGQGKRRCRV
jgi:peroxin-6